MMLCHHRPTAAGVKRPWSEIFETEPKYIFQPFKVVFLRYFLMAV
jgi:hypothetical protein